MNIPNYTEILIIGSGLSGAIAAISAADIDMTKEPIPIVPAAHYICGGIDVNLKGKTSLKRLYGMGEVACTGVQIAIAIISTTLES